MRRLITILFFFSSCTLIDDTRGRESPAPTAIDPDVSKRLIKLELDSAYQAKQIATLKNDVSTLTTRVNVISANGSATQNELTKLTAKIKADSIKTITAIKASTPITRFTNDSIETDRDLRLVNIKIKSDSVKYAASMNLLTPLQRFRRDSIDQWVAIKVLQSASPVTAIPIMQNDIKNIESKNTSQDKLIIGLQSQVNTVGGNVDSVMKYATKVNLVQFEIINGVVTIPSLVTLQVRVAKLEEQALP